MQAGAGPEALAIATAVVCWLHRGLAVLPLAAACQALFTIAAIIGVGSTLHIAKLVALADFMLLICTCSGTFGPCLAAATESFVLATT